MPQPRRMPSSRSDTLRDDDRRATMPTTIATPATPSAERRCDRSGHRRALRRTRVRSAPHRVRPDRRSTSATSSPRGWNARAASRATIAEASTSPSNSNRYVTQPPSDRYVRVGPQRRAAAARAARTAATRPRRSAPRWRRRRRSVRGGRSVTSTAWPPACRSRARSAPVVATHAHAADVPAGGQRGDARHRGAVGTAWAIRIITSSVPHVGSSPIGSSAGVNMP